MKYAIFAAAAALTLLATDAAMARGRRGCPGGVCSVGAVQAPVQKLTAKEPSPSDQAAATPAETPAAAPAAATTQRTRRFASFSRIGRRN